MPYKQATPNALTSSGRQNSLKTLNQSPIVNSYKDRTRPANKNKHFGLTDMDTDHESFKGGIRDLNLQPLSPNLSHDSLEKQSTSSGNTPLKKAQLKKTTHPRKFLSPYLMFLKEKRAEFLDAENRGDMSASDIMRMIRQMWHSMDEKEKEKYQGLSGRDKERYEKELKERNITDRKRRRPLGKPKKSLSTYMIFVREMRKQIADECPGMEVLEIMKEVGRRWRLLKEEDKIPLQKKADQDKLRYNKEMRKYIQQQQMQQHQQQLGKRAKVKKATGSDSNESNFEDEEEDSEFTESPKKRKKREPSRLLTERSLLRIQPDLKDKIKQEDSNQNRVLLSEKENLNRVNGGTRLYHREPFSECKQAYGTPPFIANQNSVPLHPNNNLSIEIPHSIYSQQKAPEYSLLGAHYTGCQKSRSTSPYPCDIGVALPPLKAPQEIPEIDLSSAQSPSIFSSAVFQSSPQNFHYYGSGGMTPSPIFFRPSMARRTASGFAPKCPGFYPFEEIKPEGQSGNNNPFFKLSNPLESPRVSCDFGSMFNYVDSNTNNGQCYENLQNEEFHNQFSNDTGSFIMGKSGECTTPSVLELIFE